MRFGADLYVSQAILVCSLRNKTGNPRFPRRKYLRQHIQKLARGRWGVNQQAGLVIKWTI